MLMLKYFHQLMIANIEQKTPWSSFVFDNNSRIVFNIGMKSKAETNADTMGYLALSIFVASSHAFFILIS